MKYVASLFAIGLAACAPPRFAGDANRCRSARSTAAGGTITGVVCAIGTGEPLGGVTIVASPDPTRDPGELSISDAAGNYTLSGLAPGDYTLHFYFEDVTYARAGVHVTAQAGVVVDQRMPESAPEEASRSRQVVGAIGVASSTSSRN